MVVANFAGRRSSPGGEKGLFRAEDIMGRTGSPWLLLAALSSLMKNSEGGGGGGGGIAPKWTAPMDGSPPSSLGLGMALSFSRSWKIRNVSVRIWNLQGSYSNN
jgi:hypothetical protein